MTDASLTYTLAPPPVRFRPTAPEPLERDPGILPMLFDRRMARNQLAALSREAFELSYRRLKVLHFTYHGINDPEAIKRVFLDNAANYHRPRFVKRLLQPLLGARWLATFRFAPVPGRTVEPRADFTLRPDGGLPLVVERL